MRSAVYGDMIEDILRGLFFGVVFAVLVWTVFNLAPAVNRIETKLDNIEKCQQK